MTERDVVTKRIVHRANKLRGDGGASALCFRVPRAIDLKRESWTARDSAVTCPKCIAIIDEATEPTR